MPALLWCWAVVPAVLLQHQDTSLPVAMALAMDSPWCLTDLQAAVAGSAAAAERIDSAESVPGSQRQALLASRFDFAQVEQ